MAYKLYAKHDVLRLITAAEAGDREAMLELVEYLTVEGYATDEGDTDIASLTERYMRLLAQEGNTDAMIMWADACAKAGRSEEALEWYERAAKLGENFGYECMGLLYYEGKCVPQDYGRAFALLTHNAKASSACTTYTLGEMYRQGQGVGENLERAAEYYNEILDDGEGQDDYYPCAMYRMAQCIAEIGEDAELLEWAQDLLTQLLAKVALEEDFIDTNINLSLVAETLSKVQEKRQELPVATSFSIMRPMEEADFAQRVVAPLSKLRDKAYEHIVVELKYAHPAGVVFIQAACCKDYYRVELAFAQEKLVKGEVYFASTPKLWIKLYHLPYEKASSLPEVIAVFKYVLVANKAPAPEDLIDFTAKLEGAEAYEG